MNRETDRLLAGLGMSPMVDQRRARDGGAMTSVLSVMSPADGVRWAMVVTMLDYKALTHLRPRMERAGMKMVGKGAWKHRNVPQTSGGKGEGGGPTRIVIRDGRAVEQVWEWVEKHPPQQGAFRNLRTRLAMTPPPPLTPMWMDAALASPVLSCVIPEAIAGDRLREAHAGGDITAPADVEAGNSVLEEVLAEAAASFRLWAGLVVADFGDVA